MLYGQICRHWVPWSSVWEHTHLIEPAWVDFGSYVAISVVYAVFAAWMCVAISPYAAGSGIRYSDLSHLIWRCTCRALEGVPCAVRDARYLSTEALVSAASDCGHV